MEEFSQEYVSHLRLDRGDAVQIVTHLVGISVEQAAGLAMTSHPKAYPPAVSRKQPSTSSLQDLRNAVLTLAKEFGFPERRGKSGVLSKFDAALGNLLVDELNMTPAEAGNEEVWSFLTLVLLPDIATWRFPNTNANPEFARWIGKPRNVLRKTWWRAYVLGPELNLLIGEDEGVNIMERPTFGLNPTLARVITRAHVYRSPDVDYPRSELLRRVMVQMGRMSMIVNLDSLSEEALTALVDEIYQDTVTKLPPVSSS